MSKIEKKIDLVESNKTMKQLLTFPLPKLPSRNPKTIFVIMKTYEQLFYENPKDINNLIKTFLGEGITRFCEDCEKITDNVDWLDQEYCPVCYSRCHSDICSEIMELEYLTKNDCDDKYYCDMCDSDFIFYCECCSENKCVGNTGNLVRDCNCEGYRECRSCECKYCENCWDEGAIFLCMTCQEWSCCEAFMNTYDNELICCSCISWIKPHRCS